MLSFHYVLSAQETSAPVMRTYGLRRKALLPAQLESGKCNQRRRTSDVVLTSWPDVNASEGGAETARQKGKKLTFRGLDNLKSAT